MADSEVIDMAASSDPDAGALFLKDSSVVNQFAGQEQVSEGAFSKVMLQTAIPYLIIFMIMLRLLTKAKIGRAAERSDDGYRQN